MRVASLRERSFASTTCLSLKAQCHGSRDLPILVSLSKYCSLLSPSCHYPLAPLQRSEALHSAAERRRRLTICFNLTEAGRSFIMHGHRVVAWCATKRRTNDARPCKCLISTTDDR